MRVAPLVLGALQGPPLLPGPFTSHHAAPGALGPLCLAMLKDKPQMMPVVPSFGESPPLSPIHTDMQESIKAEPKRLLNSIVASKYRKHNLELI